MESASPRNALRLLLAGASIALGLASLGGCASPPPAPESVRDPQANFGAYRTFGWTSGGGVDAAAEPPLKMLDASIRAAIKAELVRRGYVEAPADATPDLRMMYETASADRIENSPVRVGVGVGGWGGNAGGAVGVSSASVRNYKEGTLVVHAIDNARNAEVWQGRISTRITQGSLEPAAVNTVVATAMRDFPARSAQH